MRRSSGNGALIATSAPGTSGALHRIDRTGKSASSIAGASTRSAGADVGAEKLFVTRRTVAVVTLRREADHVGVQNGRELALRLGRAA
jgi:hypothetical protein